MFPNCFFFKLVTAPTLLAAYSLDNKLWFAIVRVSMEELWKGWPNARDMCWFRILRGSSKMSSLWSKFILLCSVSFPSGKLSFIYLFQILDLAIKCCFKELFKWKGSPQICLCFVYFPISWKLIMLAYRRCSFTTESLVCLWSFEIVLQRMLVCLLFLWAKQDTWQLVEKRKRSWGLDY